MRKPTQLEKFRLLVGPLVGETAYVGPFFVGVDITRRCNLHCVGCRFHSTAINKTPSGDRGILDFSFDLFKRLCGELRTMGTTGIFLVGEGEPLLHRRIFDMITTAKDAGLHVTMFTNGTLLDDERCQALVESQLDVLKVSLWASTADEYEQNYPGTAHGNFEKVLNGL